MRVLQHMAKNKSGDKSGLTLEMYLHGGHSVCVQLANIYNTVLSTGQFPDNCYESHFSLLPKGGDLNDPGNWRPIAMLSTSYKIFARALYERLRPQLDTQQSEEQYGFRKSRSTSHALLVLENIIGKAMEWNLPLWIVSLDLKKAFDRVEHDCLFQSLLNQGVQADYVEPVRLLYKQQKGILGESVEFPVGRGVRQGDVLSPLLFNACLDEALRQWKTTLSSHGVALDPADGTERLTNIRYADDVLLIGKSLAEVRCWRA